MSISVVSPYFFILNGLCPPGSARRRGRTAGVLLLIAALPLAALAGSLLCGCSGEETDAPGGPQWNMLLITLDTTRSDRLGCYGCPFPTSPNIDRLAAQGILFEKAVAPTPLTLPSHATILTGLDPNEHGVRNNNSFVLDEQKTTIPETLARRGYATGATLGAFPVDARFGLAQGFESYDDDFAVGSRLVGLRMTQRNADEVTTKTLDWIGRHKKKPFFHWAHYFDVHFPWEAPEEYSSRFKHPYDGEVAFMDAEIGRLHEGLERLGLASRTWILLVGDHGESLDEHGELNHSMLIYGATQSVPCILVPPAQWSGLPDDRVRGRRIGSVVRLKDLAATMLDALGFAADTGDLAPSPFAGSSLLSLAAGTWEGPGFAYMETLAPALEYGWSELRGVRTERWSYIRAPEPELYDLAADPGELNNVHDAKPDVAKRLARLCDDLTSRDEEINRRPSDPETVEKLRSLGYAALPARRGSPSSGKNPREMLHVVDRINDAATALGTSRAGEAEKILREALREDPGNPEATRLLVRALLCLGDRAGMQKACAAHLAIYPDDSVVLLNSAQASALGGDYDAAVRTLERILKKTPLDREAGDFLPRVLVQAGRMKEARAFLEEGLRRAPRSAVPLVRFGYFELFRENPAAARRHAEKALVHDPEDAGAHTILGEVLRNDSAPRGQPGGLPAQARGHFEKALAADPLDSMAAFRLGCHHHACGEPAKARDLYQAALFRRPNWPEAHARLADVLWKLKEYGTGLDHFAIADRLGFANPGFLLTYGTALARVGKRAEAIAAWEKALAGVPDGSLAEKLRRNIEKLKE